MEIKAELEKTPSRCETCNSNLGCLKSHAPLYCIPCIEEMDRLGMGPKAYKKHRMLNETVGKKAKSEM